MARSTKPDEQQMEELLAKAEELGILSSSQIRGEVITMVYSGITFHFDWQNAYGFLRKAISAQNDLDASD